MATTTKTTTSAPRTSARAGRSSGGHRALSAAGRRQGRVEGACDLVSVREAAARLGMRESTLSDELAKRCSGALVAGKNGWLVDLWVLADDERVAVPAIKVEIVESGSFL